MAPCGRPFDVLGERRSFHQLQYERRNAVGVLDAVDVADVRVAERGESLGLAFEAREPIGIGGHCVRKHFESHVAIQFRIARAVDFAHPASADLGDDDK